MKLERVAALASKEWREILRDPIYLMLAFVLPVVLMLVFGHGMSPEMERIGLVVLDEDRSATSREYLDHFTHTRHLRALGTLGAPREIEPALATARARVAIWIPAGFERALYRGQVAQVQFLIDGTFPFPARTLRGYLEAINAAASAEFQAGYLARVAGLPPERALAHIHPLRVQVRYLYNEEARSIWTIAPALLMLILLLVPPLLMAVSVVREKESGAIYNVRCSTVTRAEFIVGKLTPILVVSALDAAVLWLIAVVYFGTPFKGSALVLGAGTALYMLGTAGAGLLISMLVRTQQAAIIIATMTAMIVATQFSGLFSPVDSLGGANRVIAGLFPAAYYYDVVMGTFLKRSGLAELAPQFLFLAGYAVAVLALCRWLFRKRTRT